MAFYHDSGESDHAGAVVAPRIEFVTDAPQDRAGIVESWKMQRDKRANQFLAYFTSEQEIIGAYNELLKLYADKRGAMSVDVANKKIMFTNPADQVAAACRDTGVSSS